MSSFTITFTFPWTFCLCLFRPLRSRYSLQQISQENFMPWWAVSMWVFNLGLSLNPIPQILQMWGFSCKWVPKNEREKKTKVSMLEVAAFCYVKVDFFRKGHKIWKKKSFSYRCRSTKLLSQKRRHLAVFFGYFASASSDKEGPAQKKSEITTSKKAI